MVLTLHCLQMDDFHPLVGFIVFFGPAYGEGLRITYSFRVQFLLHKPVPLGLADVCGGLTLEFKDGGLQF